MPELIAIYLSYIVIVYDIIKELKLYNICFILILLTLRVFMVSILNLLNNHASVEIKVIYVYHGLGIIK